jgi:Na+/H+-dicarboxylate symporter/ABC-type amino acid transport substrate-binding protein
MSRRIMLGLVGGIAVGLFFGERAAILDWPARAFVQLLQVTVLPYVVTSLITGIAGGTAAQARRLASTGGVVLVLLWLLALGLVFLSPLAFPPDKGGAFYAAAASSGEPPIDWIDLYIPSNPFYSLANNVVPAVVVFSILLGIALLGIPDKARILAPLRLVNATLGRAGTLLVQLTPVGIFAIAGSAAGTLRIEEFERLQAFLFVWVGLALILTLWILPALATLLTGVPTARILSLMWDPLITAFVTANLFIVLPVVQERAKLLLAEARFQENEIGEPVDVLVPTSFAFPHSAKLLSLAFVVFAGWFAGAPVTASEFPMLAGAGVLSLFGSLNTALPFLLDLVRLPADLFQLFIISSVVNSRFGSAAAAMHTLALGLIGAAFMSGRVRLDKSRLAAFAVMTTLVVGGFLLVSRVALGAVLPGPEGAAAIFDLLRVSGAWGRMAVLEPTDEDGSALDTPPAPGRRLESIVERGSVRVCVSPDAMPWCYLNSRGETVGLEVDVAHVVADQLRTRLTLVQVPRVGRAAALGNATCDIATGTVIPSQVAHVAFSRPLTHEAWAFLTRDYQRALFTSVERVRALPSPRIAVLGEPQWVERLQSYLPNARVMPVASIPDFIAAPVGRYDAMFTGLDRATAYSLVSPEFAAVVPAPGIGGIPLAITVPKGEEALLDFANAVVDVGTANGLFKEKIDYWVRGAGPEAEKQPRWSVGGTLLGLWED